MHGIIIEGDIYNSTILYIHFMNVGREIFATIFALLLAGIPFISNAQGVRPAHSEDPFVVIIDPGHGGFDSGAVGSYSTEKEIALGISLKTGKLIDKIPGVTVFYTRKTDMVPGHKTSKYDGLHYRADFANAHDGNVFISIHCNASRNQSAKGTEVYVWALRKNSSKGSTLRENSGLEDGSKDGALSAIFWNSVRRSYMQQSLQLAADVERQFSKLGRINRSVKQRNEVGIWVLHATAMPSILIETGFISNPKEEDYLNHHQDEIAKSIFKAFVEYLAGLKGVSTQQLLAGTSPNKEESTASGMDSHYKIQLFASSRKIDTDTPKFKKLDDIVLRKAITGQGNKKLYRYLLGDYKSYQAATEKLKQIKPLGYKGAFIVTYKGHQRIGR